MFPEYKCKWNNLFSSDDDGEPDLSIHLDMFSITLISFIV